MQDPRASKSEIVSGDARNAWHPSGTRVRHQASRRTHFGIDDFFTEHQRAVLSRKLGYFIGDFNVTREQEGIKLVHKDFGETFIVRTEEIHGSRYSDLTCLSGQPNYSQARMSVLGDSGIAVVSYDSDLGELS